MSSQEDNKIKIYEAKQILQGSNTKYLGKSFNRSDKSERKVQNCNAHSGVSYLKAILLMQYFIVFTL